MELCSCNDFSELLHVSWLDIDDVEALILNVKVPQVDSKIIAAYERLAVRIYRYTVNMISMRISICLSWNCSYYGIVMRKTG